MQYIDLYLIDLLQLFEIPGLTTVDTCYALVTGEQLSCFLPIPRLVMEDAVIRWSSDDDYPSSVGRTSAFGASKLSLLSIAIELQLRHGMK